MNWLLMIPSLIVLGALVLWRCQLRVSLPVLTCALAVWGFVAVLAGRGQQSAVRVQEPEWQALDELLVSPDGGSGNARPEIHQLTELAPDAVSLGALLGEVAKPRLPELDLAGVGGVGVAVQVGQPHQDWDSLITKRLLAHKGKEGKFTATLIWFSPVDLDLWLVFDDGKRIGFPAQCRRVQGAELDVDSNWMDVIPDPVENITFESDPPQGGFRIFVDHFKVRNDEHKTKFILRILDHGERKLYFGEVTHDLLKTYLQPEHEHRVPYSF